MLKSLNQIYRERLAKGGPGSGRYPAGSGGQGEDKKDTVKAGESLLNTLKTKDMSMFGGSDNKENREWEARVRAYEDQGMTRSDAQGVVDAEDMKKPPSGEFLSSKLDQEALDQTTEAYTESTRKLDWEGKETNAQTYLEQAKIVSSYNEFNPEVAKEVVDTFGEKATYRLGREGSVVTYVKNGIPLPSNAGAFTEIRQRIKADELNVDPATKEIRIWWD